jgi:RHS repeat-associated protein
MARFVVICRLLSPLTPDKMPLANHSSSFVRSVLSVSLLLVSVGTSWSQNDPAAGLVPFSTQVPGLIESVDMATSNINVQIKVRDKIGKLPFSYRLVMNSHAFVAPGCTGNPCSPPPRWLITGSPNGGLNLGLVGQLNLGATVGYTSTPQEVNTCSPSPTIVSAFELTNFFITDSTGAVHPLISIGPIWLNAPANCTFASSGTDTTIDGSGYTLVASPYTYTVSTAGGNILLQSATFTVYDRSGNAYAPNYDPLKAFPNPLVVVQDPDGATITSTSEPATYGQWVLTDTLGEPAITETLQGGQSQSTDYQYTDVDGNTQTFQVNYSAYTQQTNFGCQGVQDLAPISVFLPSTVTTPTETISFTYETTRGDTHTPPYVTGRLASITYPTGGTVSYSYSGSNNGVSCSNGVVPTLTRTVNDNNGHISQWTYVNTNTNIPGITNNPFTVMVTDPLNNQTVYSFNGFEHQTEAKYYQGSATGTLLKTVFTCYGNHNTSQTDCLNSIGGFPTDVYTYRGSSLTPSLVHTVYDIPGKITEVDNYDFGATFPPSGSPVSKTTTSYDSGGACGTLASAYITDRPCSVTTVNSSNSIVSKTNYVYNSTGHPTQTSKLVSGSTYLTSSTAYAANGVATSVTDANSAVTQYSNGPGVGACNGFLPVGTAYPQIGTVQMSSSQAWDCNGGVTMSTTDPNLKTTAYSYAGDPFWRIVGVTDPSSANLYIYYNPFLPGNGNEFVDSIITLSGGPETDTIKYLDQLGRLSEMQHRQAPLTDVYDTVAYTYDLNGRQNSVSIPCVASGDEGATCSSATTTQTYDAVDRPLVTTDGGGGTVSNTYSGRDVLSVTSSPTTGKQYEYDGLGRLISVCEISSTLPGVGTCRQDTAKTGYWTRYQYDAVGNLTAVCQNTSQPYSVDCVASPSAGQQTRKFTYDGLGRMTSESNPESGLKQYFYDSAPSTPGVACPGSYKGDLVKVYDSNGNTTCFTYDGLHRLSSTTYFGPNSNGINRYFVYDVATVNGTALQNTKGRLAEAYTAATQGGTKTTDEGFSYSVRGDLTDVYESTPHSGGFYHTTASYFENGVVKTLAGVPGQTGITYGVDSEGRQVTAKQGTTNLVTGTTFNAASQPLTVTLGQGDTDNYVYYPSTGLMNKYTFTVGATPKSVVGILTYNTNGSLNNLSITDGFNAGGTQTCKYGDAPNNIPGYDDLGRLIKVDCGASIWQQNFSYDAFGNLTKAVPTGGTGIAWNPGYNSANNRYTLAGTSYDANGDLVGDTFHGYSWNGDGHVISIDSSTCGSNGTCLTYDALGRIVEKNVAGAYIEILYSPMGKLAVMNGQTLVNAYFPLPGGATYNVTPGYARLWHKDWLSTVRLSTTLNNRSVDYDRSFAPFGEVYKNFGSTANDDFTGDTQDTITGTYDTTNRELNPSQGRWLSPDPAGLDAADPSNPQSWNRYVYVFNKPLVYRDPQGLWCYYGTTDDNGKIDLSSPDAQNSGNYDFSIASGGTGVDKKCESGGTWYDPGENPFSPVVSTVDVNGNCPPDTTCYTFDPLLITSVVAANNPTNCQAPFLCNAPPPKPTATISAIHPPTEAQIRAACTVVAINSNNGFGNASGDSRSASNANGVVFQQYTQYPRPTTMNPSAPNIGVLAPLAAPGLFVQATYQKCLSKFGVH